MGTKKPVVPFQLHRQPNSSGNSGPSTPVSAKSKEKDKDFSKKLSDSLHKLDKHEEKGSEKDEFKKPGKIEDRRRSSSSSSSKEDRKDSRDHKEKSRDRKDNSSVDKERKDNDVNKKEDAKKIVNGDVKSVSTSKDKDSKSSKYES